MFEEPDTIGKKSDIESNNEATVGDDSLWAKGARNDGVAEKGSIIKDEGELRFVAEAAFEPPFVEDEPWEDNKHEHDKCAGEETRGEEAQGGFVIFTREGDKEWRGHKYGK